MSLRNLLIYIFGFLVFLFSSVAVQAQTRSQDSAALARERAMEATRMERQRSLDSMKKVRQRRTDSLATVKKYRESKRYKDSVAKARETKLSVVKAERTRQLDSVKAERKRVMDSTLASRRTMTEQIRAVQKRRTDSMAAIRKYRESKRYQDSVVVVRKLKMDSVKAIRKVYTDSIAQARKRINDSSSAARKTALDSTIAVRKKSMDSMKAVRKVRTDSLAKVKAERDKLKKIKAKEKEEKMQLAVEIKIKKKQEAWSNEKMLKKKWSLPRQVIQNTFTRYNYYFNADRKMDEALDNMQRVRKEDYDKQLALFPFDPDVDSSLLASDMDSIIQKASVGIQIHDPRTKWGDDLYLLLGQAYYYKGDYNNAATSFRYIVSLRDKNEKNKKSTNTKTKAGAKGASIAQAEEDGFLDFMKHRSAHNEALLWLSRTYTESHQEGNAESVIDLLEADPNMPASLKGRLALEKAYIQLSLGNNKEAIPELEIVSKDKELPEWVRMRAAFLSGQLLQQQGEHQKAAASFDQVLALNPKIDMDFYARRNMAHSRMLSGGNPDEALASLKKVLNDGKYAPYYEQIYYMMGRLAANGNNHKEAIIYLQKSINSPKSTRKQKAISFAALGNVYYDMHQYMVAKTHYDSAAAFASAAAGDSMLTAALRRSMVLGNVTGPLTKIHHNDSLLALASMSSKEQTNVVRRHIRRLEQQKSDSAFKAENAGLQNANQQQNNNAQGGATNTYANWYFNNPVLMQQGYNEFKRKWGNRTLVDNWRRSSAASGFVNNNNTGAGADDDEDSGVDENGLPTEASLLAHIPNTAQKQNGLKTRNMQAYMAMARAYINELEDFPQALATLDTLEKRYPTHPDKAEAVYLRYLVAMKQGRMEEAKKHTAKLLKDYSESKWAALVRPSEDGAGIVSVSSTTLANFYDEAYGLLMQRQYTDVLQRMQVAKKQYSDPTYKKRFQIMEAIALVGTGDYNKAEGMLTDFMSTHPSDSLRAWAEATLGYIKTHKPATPPPAAPQQPSGSNVSADTVSGGKGAMRAAAEVSTPTAPAAPSVPESFTYKPNEEHYVLFWFPALEQRAMGVKAAMNDFNTFKFTGQGLTSDLQMLNKQQGVVVTQKFKNAAQARLYMNALRGTSQVFREYKAGEYSILIISANNYVKMVYDRDIQPYMKFYNANYK